MKFKCSIKSISNVIKVIGSKLRHFRKLKEILPITFVDWMFLVYFFGLIILCCVILLYVHFQHIKKVDKCISHHCPLYCSVWYYGAGIKSGSLFDYYVYGDLIIDKHTGEVWYKCDCEPLVGLKGE